MLYYVILCVILCFILHFILCYISYNILLLILIINIINCINIIIMYLSFFKLFLFVLVIIITSYYHSCQIIGILLYRTLTGRFCIFYIFVYFVVYFKKIFWKFWPKKIIIQLFFFFLFHEIWILFVNLYRLIQSISYSYWFRKVAFSKGKLQNNFSFLKKSSWLYVYRWFKACYKHMIEWWPSRCLSLTN